MEPWLERFARASFRRSADTAHDLKTPLNVAVLNLELLRMRLRKLMGDDDEKIAAHAQAIETELRRLGSIFDAFFLLSTPPKNGEEPTEIDLAALAAETGFDSAAAGPAIIRAHEARIRRALKLFYDSAPKLFHAEHPRFQVRRDDSVFTIGIAGQRAADDLDLTKVFRLYYTDAHGNPDLSLALARLIAETYGGELNAAEDRGTVMLQLTFPLGER